MGMNTSTPGAMRSCIVGTIPYVPTLPVTVSWVSERQKSRKFDVVEEMEGGENDNREIR